MASLCENGRVDKISRKCTISIFLFKAIISPVVSIDYVNLCMKLKFRGEASSPRGA